LTAWHQENRRLKALGIPASERPRKPKPHPNYPTKQALAQDMLQEFTARLREVAVKAVLANALYGTCEFMDQTSAITGNAWPARNWGEWNRLHRLAISHAISRFTGVKSNTKNCGMELKALSKDFGAHLNQFQYPKETPQPYNEY
jgi:hypothetical protein